MMLKDYKWRPLRFYVTTSDLACLTQGFVYAFMNVFQQFIHDYTYQDFIKLYLTNPDAAIRHMESNQSNIDFVPVVKKFKKGTKIGLYVMIYRSLCRLFIDYKYHVTAETLIRTKAESALNYLNSTLSKFYYAVVNNTGISASKVDNYNGVIVVSPNQSYEFSSLGWLDFAYGRKRALKSFAGRVFFHFAEISIWLLDIAYRKVIGKDKDDAGLTFQKILARIACAFANSLAFFSVSYVIFSIAKRQNLPISMIKILLEVFVSSIFVAKTQSIMTTIFPRLKEQPEKRSRLVSNSVQSLPIQLDLTDVD